MATSSAPFCRSYSITLAQHFVVEGAQAVLLSHVEEQPVQPQVAEVDHPPFFQHQAAQGQGLLGLVMGIAHAVDARVHPARPAVSPRWPRRAESAERIPRRPS